MLKLAFALFIVIILLGKILCLKRREKLMDKRSFRLKITFKNFVLIAFCILALSISGYVLFKHPQPGVADQGDFDRVMGASGLELTDADKNNPSLNRFYKYTITDYKISDANIKEVISRLKNTSMAYIITLINFVCKIFGQNIFKTSYLSLVYILLYTIAIFLIIKYLNIHDKAIQIFFVLAALFMLYDGNYLVWFNSLYGEPMMLTTLLLYIAALVYYNYYKNSAKSNDNAFRNLIFVYFSAFLFLGSKMQTLTALPIVMLLNLKLFWENRKSLKKLESGILLLALLAIIVYPLIISTSNKAISKDTQYNAVFYGILKDSKNPKQDLVDLGLNPDMAVEAGKHSYLNSKEYVKYVPRTELTEKEFYSKISNGKLIKFYITHPLRLMDGMMYTGSKAFFTSTSLGKFKENYSKEPIREFNRFTLWSSIREKYMPKSFVFIFLLYAFAVLISLITYRKAGNDFEFRGKLWIFWTLIFISVLQFPMPFMGNGHADTAKQLYLFNFIFDLILIVAASFCLKRLIFLCRKILEARYGKEVNKVK